MNKLPNVGDLLLVDGINTVKFDNFDPAKHALPDLWTNRDEVEVISMTNVNGIKTPVVKNIRTRQLSPISLNKLSNNESMVKRVMRDVIEECRELDIFDIERAVIDSMYERLNIKLKAKGE